MSKTDHGDLSPAVRKSRPPTKIAALRALMAAEAWDDALRFAARFPQLGDERQAIQRGAQAVLRPEFVRQLRRDPTSDRREGIDALRRRYSSSPPA